MTLPEAMTIVIRRRLDMKLLEGVAFAVLIGAAAVSSPSKLVVEAKNKIINTIGAAVIEGNLKQDHTTNDFVMSRR